MMMNLEFLNIRSRNMSNPENALVIPDEVILSKIYFIRELKVMIDSDLAEL